MPSFSPHAVAGSSTWAWRVVSVCRMQSDTTTRSQASSAARARSTSGRLTSGLVDMIQTALMRRSAIASNISTALSPLLSAMTGERQKRCTMSRCCGFSISIWAASWLASPPTSRPPIALGWPVSENGPMPGRPMRPVNKMAIDDRVDLVDAAARLVDALRIQRDDALGFAKPVEEAFDRTAGQPAHGCRVRDALAGDLR